MEILFKDSCSMEEMRDQIRALPRPPGVTDEIVEAFCRHLFRVWRVNFSEKPQADDLFRIGASKFGGRPDVPAGWSWPPREYDGTPLGFLLQVNFADLDVTDQGFPADGLLLLFWCPNTGGGSVQYFPAGTPLERFSGETPISEELTPILPAADMLVREYRWLGTSVWADHAVPYSKPRQQNIEIFLHECKSLLDGSFDEENYSHPQHPIYGKAMDLFGTGAFNYLSYFNPNENPEDLQIIFSYFYTNAPDFDEIADSGHYIHFQFLIDRIALSKRDFRQAVASSMGEG